MKLANLPRYALAGVTLAGYRMTDGIHPIGGNLSPDPKPMLADWPKTLEVHGNTYTLEEVKAGAEHDMRDGFENAEYV